MGKVASGTFWMEAWLWDVLYCIVSWVIWPFLFCVFLYPLLLYSLFIDLFGAMEHAYVVAPLIEVPLI